MTYREPIAPNPEPAPPKVFDRKRARRVAAWCFVVWFVFMTNALLVHLIRHGTHDQRCLGCVFIGLELVALLIASCAELGGAFE